MKTAGAVLCGGLSRRMGRDKALLPWRGRTLVEHIVATLCGAVDEILVVGSQPQSLPAVEARIVTDRESGLGPLGGIREALEAATADLVFVTGTDHPFLTASFVRCVLSFGVAAAPVTQGHVQSLAAAYPKALARTADRLIEEGRMRPLFLLEAADFRPIPPGELPELDSLRGLNTPDAYLEAIAKDGATGPVIVQLSGRTGPRQWQTTPARLNDVLGGLPSGRYRSSLNGHVLPEDANPPLGPGDRLLIEES